MGELSQNDRLESQSERLSPIKELVSMSVPDFRSRYSIPFSVPDFDRPENVWWTSTDMYAALEIADRLSQTGERGGIFMGISGGVDSTLTLLAAAKPDLAILIDTNPHALNYLQYRLQLTTKNLQPTEYLDHVFPGKLPLKQIIKAPNREALYDLINGHNLFGLDKRMRTDWTKVFQGIAQMQTTDFIPTGVSIEDVTRAAIKKLGIINDPIDVRITPNADLYTFLHSVVQSKSWLYMKDPTNYLWIRDAWVSGKIKIAQLPAQLMDQSPLQRVLEDKLCPPVHNFYIGNLNEYLSDKDFRKWTANLRLLPHAKDMNIIYGSIPLNQAKLGEENGKGIETAPNIRKKPWMTNRSLDITI